jgi:hypothetical protein
MFCSFRSLMFCSNAYDAASRDSVILSFSWPSQLNHNLGLFSLDHRWFSGKINITKAAMAGWQDLDPQRVWLLCNTCELITVLCMIILSSTLQRRRWALLLIAMPEIYNRLTGYKGIKVPAIPNLESNFFYHFLHTHTDPTFLSLSLSPLPPYFILICWDFSRKRVDRVMQLLFCKVFWRSPTW